MAKDWKGGLYPAPVYEATLADGRVVRASFWTKAGKPIDYEAGRRTIAALYARPDAVAMTAEQEKARHEEIQRANRQAAALGVKRDQIRAQYGEDCWRYDNAEKLYQEMVTRLAFLQTDGPERAASFFVTAAPPQIVRGFVEHASIGRVADPMSEKPAKVARSVPISKLRAALAALNLPADAVLAQLEAA